MTERPGPPEPLTAGLEDLLAEFRNADALPEPARERIWKTVGADEPPRRRFVPPPPATAHPGRRWAFGAVGAIAAAALLWLGLGDRLTADEASDDARRDAAAMVEHGDEGPRTAIDRRPVTRTRAPAPEPEPSDAPAEPAPLEPNAPGQAEAPDFGSGSERSPERRPERRPERKPERKPDHEPESDPKTVPSSTLAAEQRLVGKAWGAITEGDPEAAMAVVRTHAEQFPSGVLAPERDAVSAIARCRISPDASGSILAAFRRAHGSSPLASRVSKACQADTKKSPTP